MWLLIGLLASAWSLSTPLFASPDEPAHVVKSAAVVRGELTGGTVRQPGTYFEVITEVEVPAYYADSFDWTSCFMTDLSATPECTQPFVADDTATEPMTTWMGRYPPLYYAIVGLPSLMVDGTAAVLGMRVVSAFLCAGLLALGLTALRATPWSRPLLAAGVLAITPTVLFFSGTVNSSGLEIAAGFATWCLLLPLAVTRGGPQTRQRLLLGAGAAVVLVNSRPGSALMAALIGGCLLIVATRDLWRSLLAGGAWRMPVALAVLGGLVAAAWLFLVDPLATLGGIPVPAYESPGRVVADAFARTPRYLAEQLGVFGTLNLTAHPVLLRVLGGTLGLLVLAGLLLGRGTGRWLVLAVAVLAVFVPALAQIPDAADLGLIWQGRYSLPFAIGLPLVAMTALLAREPVRPVVARLAPVLVAVSLLVHLGCLYWSLWRYAYGFGSAPFGRAAEWQPPGGVVLHVVVPAACALLLGLVLVLGTGARSMTGPGEPQDARG